MTLELVLFVLVAAVAIFAAAFMLVSRNAVHSALLLVVNFGCVALFYLMLNAPFLAMIQITVYAGAIMVLFMFVIMLLGSERLGTPSAAYRWVAPVSALLTAVFLVVAILVVVQGNVGQTRPIPHLAQVRVVHALSGAPAVDVVLIYPRTSSDSAPLADAAGSQIIARDLSYRDSSALTTVTDPAVQNYTLNVYPACTDADQTKCVDPAALKGKPLATLNMPLPLNSVVTLIVTGTTDVPRVLPIATDLSTLPDDSTLRVVAVNALPNSDPVTLVSVDPADPSKAPVIAPEAVDLKYGDATKVITLPKGRYNLAWKRGNERVVSTDTNLQGKTFEVLILTSEIAAGDSAPRPTQIRVPQVPTAEAFGSPQQIGVTMLSTFLLPFELVSLLLLAAMVGAIILTREDVVRRVRQRLVVSDQVHRINQAAQRQAAQGQPAPGAGVLAANAAPAVESSAD